MDRKKLIEGLRYCGSRDFCDDCPIYDECHEPDFDICLKAADVIETHMWISVEEGLPEDRERVIFFAKTPRPTIDTASGLWVRVNARYRVTHWMPLPKPPEEEKE